MTDFVLVGRLIEHDGYGYGAIKLGEALTRLTGGAVEVADYRYRTRFDKPVVAVCVPDWLEGIEAPRLIAHTMFEASMLPSYWAPTLNRYADAVLVTCEMNVSVFKNNGVNPPVYVVPWGVDPEDHPFVERERMDSDPYTFLWEGSPGKRKGWDLVYRAFREAFGDSKRVRLELHFRRLPEGLQGCDDPNVELFTGVRTRADWQATLARGDCFVFPSRGEGWGLTPREAASTGLPVIATNWGGLAEGIEHYALPVAVARMSRVEHGFWREGLGVWAEPDFDTLVTLMRWCEANRDVAAAFGRRASFWLHNCQNWEQSARALLEAVERVWLC